jgi:2-polyprenyl-3-methyl-5-hydroxy-6-metoxy-1,4-benzoquinol methylase
VYEALTGWAIVWGVRRLPLSEIENEFERNLCWGDDERYLYNPNRKKASVFGHCLRIAEVLRLVNRYSPGKRVADLACGQGNFSLLLAEQGFDVTAVDIQEDFLRYAKKKHTHGTFRTVRANLIEYRDPERFDCVLAGEVIEHVAFPRELIRSLRENLRPGGICVITTPNGGDFSSELPTFSEVKDVSALIPKQFHWGDHLFLYTAEELRGLLEEAGFEVLHLEKYHSAYVSQIKAVRYLMPLALLKWLERRTRHWRKNGKDSANLLIAVGRLRA